MRALFFIISFWICGSTLFAKTMDSLRVENQKGSFFIIHRVEKGEGMLAIARRYKVDAAEIKAVNPAMDDKLQKGMLIKIPYRKTVAGDAAPKDTTAKQRIDEAHANADARENTTPQLTYIVQPGETLSKIAQRFKISVAELSKWNNLKNGRVEAGQELIVSPQLIMKPYETWNKPVNRKGSTAQSPVAENAVEENGFAFIEPSAGGILHRDAPVGTLLLITNLENNRQCFVKVTGKLDGSKYENEILRLDAATAIDLDIHTTMARIKVKYIF